MSSESLAPTYPRKHYESLRVTSGATPPVVGARQDSPMLTNPLEGATACSGYRMGLALAFTLLGVTCTWMAVLKTGLMAVLFVIAALVAILHSRKGIQRT